MEDRQKLKAGMKFRRVKTGKLAYMISSGPAGDGKCTYQILRDDGTPVGARYYIQQEEILEELEAGVVEIVEDSNGG